MKSFLYAFIVTFFSFSSVVAEIALQCIPYKQCTTIDELGCTNLNDKGDILVVIDDEIESITINHDLFFDGKYIITKKEENQYAGWGKINKLTRDDLESWKDMIKKVENNEITKEEGEDYFYLGILQGKVYKFYLDRFLLDLKLKLTNYYPSYIDDAIVLDYNCKKIEKKL